MDEDPRGVESADSVDFGLAVALRKDTNRATGRYELTGGTGSRRYMAPEISLEVPYGVAADTYSFAIVAYEVAALTGRPFREFNRAMHAAKVIKGGARPPIPQNWNAAFRSLLRDAWHPDQDLRCDMAHSRAILEGIIAVHATNRGPGGADAPADPLPPRAPAAATTCACACAQM